MNLYALMFYVNLIGGSPPSLKVAPPCEATFDAVFSDAKVFHDSVVNSFHKERDYLKPRVSYYLNYSDFDFQNIVPLEGEVDSLAYYKVGFDSAGVMTEINHYENKPDLNNWRMVLFHTDKFIIIGVEDWTDDYLRKRTSYDFLPGFLLYVKVGKKLFFINTYHNQFANVQFAPIFPVFELSDISYIAQINHNLQMTRLFRFIDGTLIWFTNIELFDDERTIMRETIYTPTIKEFLLKKQSCVDDLEVYYDHNRERGTTKFTKPCLPKNNPRFPLWFFGGGHSHCD